MLTLYPSNQLEVLAELLGELLIHQQRAACSENPLAALKPTTILVESQGMEHWLRLRLAEHHGIAMNLNFPMPSRFVWDLCRTLLGDIVPRQSPYSRELMTWRIDRILSMPEFMLDPATAQANEYWGANTKQDPLKRFQLAGKMADIFEQYLMFRPDWLENWSTAPAGHEWQGKIWSLLVQEVPMHPLKLQQAAIERLVAAAGSRSHKIPSEVVVFGVNAMAPPTMRFFEALASCVPVHLFHLNPCVEFWGDQVSDKARSRSSRASQLDGWLSEEPRNPLLANLGGQGREFFNLLQNLGGFEISAFVDAEPTAGQQGGGASMLACIQRDILELRDARQSPEVVVDDSIIISSSHSALREIQSLHDHLLGMFANDKTLTPRDVLVMCPAIEDYAPYIDSVFRRAWDQSASSDRLPCSIADRSHRDGEPLVAAFAELLTLPDSRFLVGNILDYLRLPALQRRFSITEGDLVGLERWLRQAAVHWGLDGAHRQSVASLAGRQDKFSWKWGLDRLLLGAAQGDRQSFVDGLSLLPDVEGQDTVLLGRLIQLMERLRGHLSELCRPRSAVDWQSYLIQMLDSLFDVDEQDARARELVVNAIDSLASCTAAVGYGQLIPLAVARSHLGRQFSQADGRNQFMTGQVTFCSMVPMRSIPFRIVAILGLNDGAFPRQSTPMSFDLMASSQRRAGDRSRRGDDRYLFLESMISAREQLYLSYQGRDIRTNGERQPSLLLKEFCDYLENGYGWSFKGPGSAIRQQPLHPFSADAYAAAAPSFDAGWARLIKPGSDRDNLISLKSLDTGGAEPINLSAVASFFANPLKMLARERLGLVLSDAPELPSDDEPFEVDGILRYQIRDAFCQELIADRAGNGAMLQSKAFEMSGHLPDTPATAVLLQDEMTCCELIADAVLNRGGETITTTSINLEVGADYLMAALPMTDAHDVLLWRPGKWRPADSVSLWLHHLVANAAHGGGITSRAVFRRVERDGTPAAGEHCLAPLGSRDEAIALLQPWLNAFKTGLSRPELLHADLGHALLDRCADVNDETLLADPGQHQRWKRALDPDYGQSYIADSYMLWFYGEPPQLDPVTHGQLIQLYRPLLAAFS